MNKITEQIGNALHQRKDWLGVRWVRDGEAQFGKEVKLLDYACGTGSITKALGPLVTHIRGIDISENMVEQYNQAAQAAGLKPEQVSAVQGNLLDEEVPEHLKTPEYYDFDIAVVGLGFHHFENPVQAFERLAERVKPGTGVVLIVDFLPFDKEENSEMQKTIKTGGFAKKNMETLYKINKMSKFDFIVLQDPAIMESKDGSKQERTIFLAKGNRENTTWGKIADWVYNVQVQSGEQFQITPRQSVPVKLGLFGERNVDNKW